MSTDRPGPDQPASSSSTSGAAAAGGSLADAVGAELVAAGLPVVPAEREDRSVGGAAVIEDANDDGVWVGWSVSGALTTAAVRAMAAGAWVRDGSRMHPAMRHSGTVTFAMRDAMAVILTGAGFDVDTDADDLRPEMLLVRARRPGPTWRDPPGPLAGASGYLPGIRVRLIDGEFAGVVTTVVSAWWDDRSGDGAPDRYRVQHPDGTGALEVPAASVTLADDPFEDEFGR